MRLSIPNDGKSCFDCPDTDQSTKGQMSIYCKKKGISVFASNDTYMRCKYQQKRDELYKQGFI